jgi:phosphoglycerate dehydrogenase-like enzyme
VRREIAGKTIGIVGFGNVGRQVALGLYPIVTSENSY